MPVVKEKNNAVNPLNEIPIWILRTAKVLETVSQYLATRFAVTLFKSPIRYSLPESEKKMAKNARKIRCLVPETGKEVVVYIYGNAKKKALLVHGWAGRGTQLHKIADKLVEQGFMTVSFDAPAHGKSPGRTTMMTEFIATILLLEKTYGPFELAIGHSLGGMSLLNSLQQGLQVQRSVCIGSGDRISDILKNFVAKLALKPSMVKKMEAYFLQKYGEDINQYSSHIAAGSVKIPTLVIHDTDDADVPVSCAYHIRQHLEAGTL
ncbi:MAG: alpha/beta hydrolase, partial [Lutibacter sp.]|nr:alpha/beta hydrolase [Lutibacter sp.]